MILRVRKQGSQREAAPRKLQVENYNTAGQGGTNLVILFDPSSATYYSLELESNDEYRDFLSAVQKASHHV